MADESTRRHYFACCQAVFGLIASIVYFQTLVNCLKFNSRQNAGLSVLILCLPAGSFFVLAFVSLLRRGNDFRVGWLGLWSSAVAGYLCIGISVVTIIVTSTMPYEGGGANIGLALLALGSPLVLPILMLGGLSLPWDSTDQKT